MWYKKGWIRHPYPFNKLVIRRKIIVKLFLDKNAHLIVRKLRKCVKLKASTYVEGLCTYLYLTPWDARQKVAVDFILEIYKVIHLNDNDYLKIIKKYNTLFIIIKANLF